MAAPVVTPAALAEIKRLAARKNYSRPVVHVSWEPQKAENKRAPDGTNVWTRFAEGHWVAFILDYDDAELRADDAPTVNAYGFEFLDIFRDRYSKKIEQPRLDFNGDAFVLTDAAI
jgi:hypothetical protein